MLFPIAHAAAINTVEKTSGRQLLTGRAADTKFLTGRINLKAGALEPARPETRGTGALTSSHSQGEAISAQVLKCAQFLARAR